MDATKLIAAAMLACGLVSAAVWADDRLDFDNGKVQAIAVFGDWPYNQLLLDNASLLINSVNADRDVQTVIHVGDIHSGSMACTGAGVLPPISTSNPGWNQGVYNKFQQFSMPLVYTPGDNEWTDCHKSKEKSSGYPLKELASVRELFFARPGHTLGLHDKVVQTQAQQFDPAYPSDAKFVENLMWKNAGVVFVTVNMPGSNNDTLPWSGSFADPGAQGQEVYERNLANLHWLRAAFDEARATRARAIVIALQADMWDLSALGAGGDGLDQYTGFVHKLAELCVQFGKPVLLLNGDSHVYGADQPLADPGSATGKIHGTQPVPNLTRITVQGSTNAPAEWLKLTIDTRKQNPFSWNNVPYCNNPLSSCQ
jgi:hypothetical protein